MPFELHISIPEHGRAFQVVQQVAKAKKISAEQAATELLLEGADQHAKNSPAHRMIGLFSSEEDSAILDEVMDLVDDGRKTSTTRDIGL